MTLEQVEKQFILAVLHKHGGRRDKTALELGIGQRTLSNKLRDWGVPNRKPGPVINLDLCVWEGSDVTRTLIRPPAVEPPAD